jgi:hypothetical protein
MPQMKPTGGGKDSGGTRKESTNGETRQAAEDKPISEMVSAFKEQDRKTGFDPVEALRGTNKVEEPATEKTGTDSDQQTENGFDLAKHLAKMDLVDQHVEYLNELRKVLGKAQLKIGEWVLENIFHNDLKLARSKSPKKQNSFAAICNHPRLDHDLQGPTLRRYVAAAATIKELEPRGVDTSGLDYSTAREISKLPTLEEREAAAREVIEKSLKASEVVRLVKTMIADKKAQEPPTESKLSFDAETVIIGLETDPLLFIDTEKELASLLLDQGQVRAKFNFRDQNKIYDTAEKIKKRNLDGKSRLEENLESAEKTINFLEQLMNTFDGEAPETETQD